MNQQHYESADENPGLTDRQLERQDYVRGVILEALEQLCGKELDDDISLIGPVRDVIADEFARRGIMSEMAFYPFIEEADDPAPAEEGDAMNKINWGVMSPQYYGEVDGIMLEAFPAMSEVLQRLESLPAEEQTAWGKLLVVFGSRFIARYGMTDGETLDELLWKLDSETVRLRAAIDAGDLAATRHASDRITTWMEHLQQPTKQSSSR